MIRLISIIILFLSATTLRGQEPPAASESLAVPAQNAPQEGQEVPTDGTALEAQSASNSKDSEAKKPSEAAPGAPTEAAQPKGAPVTAKDILNPFKEDLNLIDTNELRQELVREFLPVYEYGSEGRKDPFAQPVVEKPLDPLPIHGPVLPLQTINLDQIQVKAILWNVAKPKAIIELPDGNIITIKLKDRLGNRNGYVAAIREGEVILVETVEEQGKVFSNTRILTLNQ